MNKQMTQLWIDGQQRGIGVKNRFMFAHIPWKRRSGRGSELIRILFISPSPNSFDLNTGLYPATQRYCASEWADQKVDIVVWLEWYLKNNLFCSRVINRLREVDTIVAICDSRWQLIGHKTTLCAFPANKSNPNRGFPFVLQIKKQQLHHFIASQQPSCSPLYTHSLSFSAFPFARLSIKYINIKIQVVQLTRASIWRWPWLSADWLSDVSTNIKLRWCSSDGDDDPNKLFWGVSV